MATESRSNMATILVFIAAFVTEARDELKDRTSEATRYHGRPLRELLKQPRSALGPNPTHDEIRAFLQGHGLALNENDRQNDEDDMGLLKPRLEEYDELDAVLLGKKHGHQPHTHVATNNPTKFPTTKRPTDFPTAVPTNHPTTRVPTRNPTSRGPTSRNPTRCPSTKSPTRCPTTKSPTTNPITKAPTASPTTKAPTRSPTSCSPTSCGPTSKSPTQNPTSCGPTTRNPTTKGPTTCSPTSKGPTSLNPTTYGPTTCNPTTANPSTAICINNIKDERETDVDCGGSCVAAGLPCSAGKKCNNNLDCVSGICDDALFVCITPRPTVSPTTWNPTSMAPTKSPTQVPTTKSPATKNPTATPITKSPTRSPTSCGPTSCGPVTCAPTTHGPTTCGPTTYGPTTSSPGTLAPTSTNPTLCPVTLTPTHNPTTHNPTTYCPTSKNPTQCPITREPTCNPSSISPTSVAPSYSPQVFTIVKSGDSESAASAIVIGPVVGVGVLGAIVLAVLYKRRMGGGGSGGIASADYYKHYTVREVLESSPGLNSKNHSEMSDDMLMVYCGNEMPNSVNVFSVMTKVPQEKWITTLESFLFKMGQKFIVEELSKWGNSWKALLFNFLTHALAGMEDFTVVDAKGKRVAVKKQLLTLGVMVMSKIDLEVFLAAESDDAPHIDMSMSLIEQFCRFGGEENVRRVQSLVLYLITNQLRAACFEGKKAGQNLSPSLDTVQWHHIERLVTMTRRHIFQEDDGFVFTVRISNRAFPDEKLAGAMAKLFESKRMSSKLTEDSMNQMLEYKHKRKKKVIIRRMESLRIHRNLFSSLAEFIKWLKSKLKAREKTMKLEADERRAAQQKAQRRFGKDSKKSTDESKLTDASVGGFNPTLGSAASGATLSGATLSGATLGAGLQRPTEGTTTASAADNKTRPGEFSLNIASLAGPGSGGSSDPWGGESIKGFDSTQAGSHAGVSRMGADDVFAAGAFNTFQTLSTLQTTDAVGMIGDAPEAMSVLIMSLVELGYGDEAEVSAAIEYMVEKFLKSGNMADLQEFAQHVAGEGEEKSARGGETDGIRYLSTQQEEQINKQLTVRNRHRKARNIYKVQMFGATVAVKVLEADMLLGKVKLEVTLHQQLSVNPFVVQLYGVGFSPILGWYTAMEYVPYSLTEKIFRKSAPLDLLRKFKLAVDITHGFHFLHSVGVFHRDIKPDNILITEGLGIRICDFGISEELGAHKTLKTLQYSAAIGTPMYMAPEQHILGYTMDKLSADMSRKIDVYSLGIVLLEVFWGKPMLDNILPRNPREMFMKLKESNPDPNAPSFDIKSLESEVPLEVLNILRQCIAYDPRRRPFMTQLKNRLKRALVSLQKQGLVDTDDEKDRESEIQRNRTNSTRMTNLLTGKLATLPGAAGRLVPPSGYSAGVDEYQVAEDLLRFGDSKDTKLGPSINASSSAQGQVGVHHSGVGVGDLLTEGSASLLPELSESDAKLISSEDKQRPTGGGLDLGSI